MKKKRKTKVYNIEIQEDRRIAAHYTAIIVQFLKENKIFSKQKLYKELGLTTQITHALAGRIIIPPKHIIKILTILNNCGLVLDFDIKKVTKIRDLPT